jgi:IclR family transcriptional regulator, acetate operon repressor
MSRVQVIERAFAVLAALGSGSAGVTSIAAQAGLPKSTVVRLLRSLQHEGAVEQLPGDGRYRLGPRVTTLAAAVSVERSIPVLARSHLVELAATTGETAGLSVPDGRWMHYLLQIDTPNPIAVRDWTGTYIPMHAVPSGQVVLAGRDGRALEDYLVLPLERFTARTLVDAQALRSRLEEVRQAGYALVDGEYMEGLASIAAPVRDGSGALVAAVHVHGPSYRFPRVGETATVAQQVLVTAARIGEALPS